MERDRHFKTEPTIADIMNSSPELTSHGFGWQDITVESYSNPSGESVPQNIPFHLVNINTGSAYSYESELENRYHQGTYVAGGISLYPALQPTPYRWHRDISIVSIGLSQDLLLRNAREVLNCDRVDLQMVHSTEDPLIKYLGLALKADVASGSLDGPMYAQTMANALAVHLLRKFSIENPVTPEISGGLSPQKLKRIVNYIDEHLEQKISLSDLAAIARLSQHHFSRAFKQSLGSSPHQYIIQTRIIRAQKLLKTGMNIDEVASACGFGTQSHFHRHFKKITGVTPKQFARQQQYFS